MSKYCPKCDTTKSKKEFHKRGKYLMGYCKPCQRDYVNQGRRKQRVKLRRIVAEAKSAPCQDCGESHPTWAMDFDHRDPSKKSFTIAKKLSSYLNEEVLRKEIEKCDVVCTLCHRYRTFGKKRRLAARTVGAPL